MSPRAPRHTAGPRAGAGLSGRATPGRAGTPVLRLAEITVGDVPGFRTLGEPQDAVEGRAITAHRVQQPRPRTLPGLRSADLRGTLVITNDSRGIAQEVSAALAAQGIAATVVDGVPPGTTGVIFLGGLRDDVTQVRTEALHSAREERRLFVTVQDTGGDFGLSGTAREQAGGLLELARRLTSKWPDGTIRALDIPRGPLAAQHITAELLHGGAAEAVGYLPDRHELITKPAQPPRHGFRAEVCPAPSPASPTARSSG